MTVIGIGTAGANIASLVPHISNLRAITLDAGAGVPVCSSHEEYEKSGPAVAKKLKLSKAEELTVVLCGAEKVTGITLSLLERFKDKKITVIYIQPDEFFLSKTQKLQHRVVFNVLQQYARSGLLDSMYIFSNKSIESFVGGGSISNLYDKINGVIANFIVTMDWFSTERSVVGSLHEPKDISRIRTVSLAELSESQENMFFDIENITESCFYYSVSEDLIENEENFLTSVRERVILDKDKGIDCSFSVWQNQSDTSFFYSIKYTHHIQEEKT